MPIDKEGSVLFQFDLILMNFPPSQIDRKKDGKKVN